MIEAVRKFAQEQALQAAKPLLCTECEEKPADLDCQGCNTSFCKECSELVHKLKINRSHTLVPLGTLSRNRPTKCTQHPDKDVELYCVQDKCCICVLCCLAGGHKGHEAVTIQHAYEQSKQELQAGAHRIERRCHELEAAVRSIQGKIETVKKDAHNIEDRLRQARDLLHQTVDKRVDYLANQLAILEDKQETDLQQQKVTVENRHSEMCNSLASMKHVIQSAAPAYLLSSQQDLVAQCQEEMDAVACVPDPQVPRLVMQMNIAAMATACESFGTVTEQAIYRSYQPPK
jgi:exonuclease VII small subunit